MAQDWGRALLLTPIIIGILLVVGGIVGYAVFSTQIEGNIAHQIRSQNQEIDPQSEGEAMGLIRASEELRDLNHNRNLATIAGGAGLVLIAVGWIAHDFVKGRSKRAAIGEKANRSS
jgi:hypothetical protein